MNIEKTIPFSWENWDQQDVLLHTYYNVEFLDNFGKFNKGDKFGSIDVDYGKGIIEAYNNSGTEVIIHQEYKSTPI